MSDRFIPTPGRKPATAEIEKFARNHQEKFHEEYVWQGKEGIYTWQPEGDLLGTVIFVHGKYDNVETSWSGDFGHFDSGYHEPGKPLKEQFAASGLKALFIVPEAEITSSRGEEVVWRDLQALLDAAGAKKGPVAVLSHSEGYFTVQNWLTGHGNLVHISLIDSLYGFVGKYADWVNGEGHSVDLIGAGDSVRKNCQTGVVDKHAGEVVEDTTPPAFKSAGALQAKILWMKAPYHHMTLVNGMGKVNGKEAPLIPALLRRVEAAFLRAAGKPVPESQAGKKPAAAVFEAGSGDGEDETHHVVEHPLRSELKDVPDLAQMAALHHLVLKSGTTRQEAVKAIQKALNKAIGTKLEQSGKYDSDTGKAVHDFQTRCNDQGRQPRLDTDGRLGAHTLLALDEALVNPSAGAAAAQPTPSTPAQQAPQQPPSKPGQYPLDTAQAQRLATKYGNIYRFVEAPEVKNQDNRPAFWHPENIMVEYKGPGWDPVAAGSKTKYGRHNRLIHPVLVEPLTRLMKELIAEGERIDDESMKRATIGSAWRTFAEDGAGFLRQLKKRLRLNPKIFGSLTFPAALEEDAQSNLYADSARKNFIAQLGAQPGGWTPALAQKLYEMSKQFKAPAGLSPHESGLVVDIDFPYAVVDENQNVGARFHQITTEYNADARLAGAGMWLATHSQKLGFSSYSTPAEIWHMEWLNWKGTDADRGHGKAS